MWSHKVMSQSVLLRIYGKYSKVCRAAHPKGGCSMLLPNDFGGGVGTWYVRLLLAVAAIRVVSGAASACGEETTASPAAVSPTALTITGAEGTTRVLNYLANAYSGRTATWPSSSLRDRGQVTVPRERLMAPSTLAPFHAHPRFPNRRWE